MWRDTSLTLKFFFVDGRAMLPIIIWGLHMRMWTFFFAITCIIFFALLERKGLSLPVLFRMLRCFFAGRYKQVSDVNTFRRRCRYPWQLKSF